MNIDNLSKELQEMKLNAMKKINMEINRVNRVFDEIQREIDEFKKSYKDEIQ